MTMKISKTTINMAAKRGIHLEATEGDFDNGDGAVEFNKLEDGEPWDEFHALYRNTSDGLFWVSTCLNDIDEDWPRWIPTEADLRLMLPLIAEDMKATK